MVEKNILLQRNIEVQRNELTTFANENAKLLSAAKAQSQIEIKRRLAVTQACKNEMEYEERIQEEDYQRRMHNRAVLQNQELSTELDKQTQEHNRKVQEIQRICNDAPELKELEKALKLAYLNKERAVQLEERILLAHREQDRIQAIEDQMEADRLRAIQADGDKIKAKQGQFAEQRVVLQRQIREKQAEMHEMEEQKLRDLAMVNAIVSKINEEDETQYRKRKQIQDAAAALIKKYEVQRAAEVRAQMAALKAEEDAINSYNAAMEGRSKGLEAKKQAKRDEEARIFERIAEEARRKREEEEEFNALRDMLWEEELEAKRSKDTEDRKNKAALMQRDMMVANSKMQVKKEEMKKFEMEKEANLISLMRAKFAEDEAKERAEELHRRNSRMEYTRLVHEQKAQRKSLYEGEKAKEAEELDEAARREEYRKEVIREARKRLIAEHAAKLKGFMPGKLLASLEDK